MDYTVIGDAVNLASGLQAAAPPGVTYCDRATFDAAGLDLAGDPLQSASKAEPSPSRPTRSLARPLARGNSWPKRQRSSVEQPSGDAGSDTLVACCDRLVKSVEAREDRGDAADLEDAQARRRRQDHDGLLVSVARRECSATRTLSAVESM